MSKKYIVILRASGISSNNELEEQFDKNITDLSVDPKYYKIENEFSFGNILAIHILFL